MTKPARVPGKPLLLGEFGADYRGPGETLAGDPTPVEGATLTLSGIADGSWRARWIDTGDGSERGSVVVTASGGELTLALPDFVGDLAVRLERE